MKKILLIACLAGVFLLPACSEDPVSENEADTLTQEEIEDLVLELGSQALASLFQNRGPGKTAVEVPIDETQACPGGGTNQVVGTLSGEMGGGSGTLAMDVDDILAACALALDGQTYVVNTEPALTITGSVLVEQNLFQETQVLFLNGALSLKPSRGPTFPCPVDLTFSVTLSAHAAQVTGTACGTAIDIPLTYEG